MRRVPLTHKGAFGPLVFSVDLVDSAIEAWAEGPCQIHFLVHVHSERMVEVGLVEEPVLNAREEAAGMPSSRCPRVIVRVALYAGSIDEAFDVR